MHIKVLFFGLVLLFFSACSKNMDHMLEGFESKPVLQSIMNPDSIITVYMAMSTQTQENDVNYIEDAMVLLYNNDILVDTLNICTHNNNGDYTIKRYESDIKPIAQNKYKILAILNDGSKIWGETTIPVKPDSCYPVFDTSNNFLYERSKFGHLELTLNDEVTQNNYYEILSYHHSTGMTNKKLLVIAWHSYYQIDNIVINEGYWDYRPRSVFFSDKLINGELYNFNTFITYADGYKFMNGIDSVYSNIIFDRGYLELRNTTNDYYKFRKSFVKHKFNSDVHTNGIYNLIYIGNPVEMFSNVEGGYGVVASYNFVYEKIAEKQ